MQSSGPQSAVPSGDISRRFSGRTIAALILLALAVILVGVSTTLSWWNISASNGTSGAFYLTNACAGGSCAGYQGEPGLQDAFALTNDLVLIGLALAVFTLVLFIASVFCPRVGVGTLATGIIAALLLLAAPVYLYVALPGAITTFTGASRVTSFFGSYTSPAGFLTPSVTTTWGGGSGWYVALVSFAVLLVSAIFAFSASRRLAAFGSFRAAPLAPPPPAGPFAPQGIYAPPPSPPSEVFCPSCGAHYPVGTQYCSKDATALKDVPR